MSEQTHSYEVYVFQKGRWEIHARHSLNQREAALEEAKALSEAPYISAVKLVHDVFDVSTGTSEENVIFKSGSTTSPLSSNANNYEDYDDDGSRYSKPVRKAKKGVFTKLLLLAISSFIVSGMATWVIALAIAELPQLRQWIGRSNYGDILFLIFIVGFVLSISSSAFGKSVV